MKRSKISNEDRRRIIETSLESYSTAAIASMYNLKYQTVNSIIKRYLKTGEILVKKRGGDRRSKLSLEIKQQLLNYVDEECTKTLRELVFWVFDKFNVQLSLSTIDRSLREFPYTVKRASLIPERRNSESTIEVREAYALSYRILEANNDDKNFIFLDEVGFAVVTRPSRGRSFRGQSAYLTVPAAEIFLSWQQ